jgi:hypothetical protein
MICGLTAAGRLRMQGADIHTIAQLIGHKDLRMTSRYQHLRSSCLADAVKGLDDVFGNLCYQGVTEIAALPEPCPVTSVESWRPLVDDFRNWAGDPFIRTAEFGVLTRLSNIQHLIRVVFP